MQANPIDMFISYGKENELNNLKKNSVFSEEGHCSCKIIKLQFQYYMFNALRNRSVDYWFDRV